MSKSILIKEDGTSHNLSSVTHINTKCIDIGSTNWIPEETEKTKVKTISRSGTYKASNDGCLGYSVVFVNVRPSRVTGVDVIDGKTYVVTLDENGYIVKTLVDE